MNKLCSHNRPIQERCDACMAEGLQRVADELNPTYEQLEAKYLQTSLNKAEAQLQQLRQAVPGDVEVLIRELSATCLEATDGAKVAELLYQLRGTIGALLRKTAEEGFLDGAETCSTTYKDVREGAKAYAEKVMNDHFADAGNMIPTLTKDQIRKIFIESGFSIKPGETDLREYVYLAANKLLEAFSSQETHDGSKDDPTARAHG